MKKCLSVLLVLVLGCIARAEEAAGIPGGGGGGNFGATGAAVVAARAEEAAGIP